MKLSKVASITVSLSWVFMIIVGSFFLMIAYNIVNNYKQNEDAKYDIELRQVLREIFNNYARTAGIEESKIAPLENIFKDSKVKIICNDALPILSINGKLDSNNDFLKSYPVFMTFIEQGKTDNTYMVVESFRAPFKITNMLALVSVKNLILIDRDSDFGKKLYDKFEKGSFHSINYQMIDFSQLGDLKSDVQKMNMNSVVFVTDFNREFNYDMSQLKIDSYLVQINHTTSKYGTIKFTNKTGDTKEFDYIDIDESLSLQTMAVFSSPQVFECSYNIIFDVMQNIYDFYSQKAQYYENLSKVVCTSSFSIDEQKYYYGEFNEKLIGVKNDVKTDKFNKSENLSNNIKALEILNLRFEQYNCPLIY